MVEILLIVNTVLILVAVLITVLKKNRVDISSVTDSIEKSERSLKDEFHRSRMEANENAKTNREELSKSLGLFADKFSENMKEIRESVEKQLKSIREDNTKQLDEMRKTVDEKLQKTLNDRLSQSFETVGKQLQAVQTGLGEMKNLANDVGGLKKVLSNVKMRGSFGEIQLSMLLEQILAPDQYEANVKTKSGSSDMVEFAVKLPGKDDSGTNVWLPIDAKFPKDIYEQLQEAYDEGDQVKIAVAQKALESAVKKMAKDIRDKYIDPPATTDFGIMFLPFEGIYAEIVRKAALLEELQRNFKIIVTGPTTLAAILNSLQMGFKTLAIEKRSSEVWQILSAVKTEFEKFGGLVKNTQDKIQKELDNLDKNIGVRTRAINRTLRNVEATTEEQSKRILPELNAAPADLDDDEENS